MHFQNFQIARAAWVLQIQHFRPHFRYQDCLEQRKIIGPSCFMTSDTPYCSPYRKYIVWECLVSYHHHHKHSGHRSGGAITRFRCDSGVNSRLWFGLRLLHLAGVQTQSCPWFLVLRRRWPQSFASLDNIYLVPTYRLLWCFYDHCTG